MPDAQLGRSRLVAQGLVTRPFARPSDAVAALGAMQGQDLPGVLASAALRTASGDIRDVLEDLDAGALVRGYPMRGTVFLLPAVDAVWMTELCAERPIREAVARRNRQGLDDSSLEMARELARAEMAGGTISRAQLFELWEAAGIRTTGGFGYHLVFMLIAETTLVYGPWNGTEQDLALVDQWIPDSPRLAHRFDGDTVAATAELALRYFTSHGPATVRDFAWWTKLPLTAIRAAMPLIVEELETDGAAEASFWRPGLLDEVAKVGRAAAGPLLLPGFDEFVLGYQDRLFAMADHEHVRLVPGNNGVFRRSVVAGGLVRGTWARAGTASRRRLKVEEFAPLSATRMRQLEVLFGSYPWVAP